MIGWSNATISLCQVSGMHKGMRGFSHNWDPLLLVRIHWHRPISVLHTIVQFKIYDAYLSWDWLDVKLDVSPPARPLKLRQSLHTVVILSWNLHETKASTYHRLAHWRDSPQFSFNNVSLLLAFCGRCVCSTSKHMGQTTFSRADCPS